MSRSAAEIVADMKATGLSVVQLSLLLELVITMSTGRPSGSPLDRVDDAVERRRKYDREYKRKRRLSAAAMSTGQSGGQSGGQWGASSNLSSLSEVVVEEGLSTRKEEQQPEQVEGRKRARGGTHIPENWQPSDTDMKFAGEQGLRLVLIEIEATKFRNYWTNRTDARSRMRDWSRAWQNWILNSTGGINGSRVGRQNGVHRQSGGADFFAGLKEVARDLNGDGPMAGPAGEEVPVGRVNIDG